MANHGFGHIKQKLTVEQIDKDLSTINEKRFNGCFNVEHVKEDDDGDDIWWIYLKENVDFGFPIWFNVKRNEIEFPHKAPGNAGWWFQETFVSLLVFKYHGMISDEGCDGEWEPEFHIKYPHMIDWFMIGVDQVKGKIKKAFYKKIANGCYKEELKHLPEEIKSVI